MVLTREEIEQVVKEIFLSEDVIDVLLFNNDKHEDTKPTFLDCIGHAKAHSFWLFVRPIDHETKKPTIAHVYARLLLAAMAVRMEVACE